MVASVGIDAQLSQTDITLIIGLATFLCSMGASMFIAGMNWGTVKSNMQSMDNRLAKIEGMFEMRLREGRE